jgi:hypothetical protein
MPLLGMGVVCGYLGAAPTLLWASGAIFLVLAPFLVAAAIWIYTLVFAFSSLWFAHYCLAALDKHRSEAIAAQDLKVPAPAAIALDANGLSANTTELSGPHH